MRGKKIGVIEVRKIYSLRHGVGFVFSKKLRVHETKIIERYGTREGFWTNKVTPLTVGINLSNDM